MNCDNCGKDMANDGGIHVCDTAYCNTADSPVTSAGLNCCIAGKSHEVAPKRSKAKRCWLCGNKLQSGRGVRREIDGHERDLHKFCSEQEEKEKGRSDKVYGMEF